MQVGVIGLGRMGAAMARNIARAGHPLAIHDVRPEALAALADLNATVCTTPSALAAMSEIVLTSLPGPQEVEVTMTGPHGILAGIRDGGIVLATSTVGAEQSRRHGELLAGKGAFHLDAPVSGGVEGAVAGTLTMMIGGEAAIVARAKPVIDCIAADAHHLGQAGTGSDMKFVIQMIFGSFLAVFLEGVAFGEAMGIPIDRMVAILGTSSAHHPAIGKRYAKLIANDTSPRSPLSLFAKDLALVRERCRKAGFDASLLEAAEARFARGIAAGLGARDVIALRETYRA